MLKWSDLSWPSRGPWLRSSSSRNSSSSGNSQRLLEANTWRFCSRTLYFTIASPSSAQRMIPAVRLSRGSFLKASNLGRHGQEAEDIPRKEGLQGNRRKEMKLIYPNWLLRKKNERLSNYSYHVAGYFSI